MVFAEIELPDIFQKLLDKILKIIDDNGGTITTEQFKTIFYGSPKKTLRLTDDDINDMMLWLKKSDYIIINRGNQYQETQITLKNKT